MCSENATCYLIEFPENYSHFCIQRNHVGEMPDYCCDYFSVRKIVISVLPVFMVSLLSMLQSFLIPHLN